MRRGFRPKIEEKETNTSWKTVDERLDDVPAHMACTVSPWRDVMMSGSAGLSDVEFNAAARASMQSVVNANISLNLPFSSGIFRGFSVALFSLSLGASEAREVVPGKAIVMLIVAKAFTN